MQEPPSALYQPLVDLIAPPPRLPGSFCGRPRRALPLRHVRPRQPDYVVYGLVCLRGSATGHEHDLTLHSPQEVPGGLLRGSPEDLLVELRKLPAHGDGGSSREIPQRLLEPVRGLEENEGRRLGGDTLQ